MDTKFVYHPIIPSHLEEEEEENCDFLIDDLPFSRLKEAQTDCAAKEEFHLTHVCSPSRSEEVQKDHIIAEALQEHPFSVTSSQYEKSKTSFHLDENHPKSFATPPRSFSRSSSQTRKDRTPRTMLKLMERHRENERVRHHTLNESLRVICQLIPGCSDDGRETKVVMMQRIISYIAYLENSISSLCGELGMHFNSVGTPLVNRLKKKVETRARVVKKKDEPASDEPIKYSHHYSTRRLKLSSPTIDSTTDTVPMWMASNDLVNSQDSTVPSSTIVMLSSNENSSSTWQVESDSEDIISNTGDYDPFFDTEIQISGPDCFGLPCEYLISPGKHLSNTYSAPDFSDLVLSPGFVSSAQNPSFAIKQESGFSGCNVDSRFNTDSSNMVSPEQILSTNLVPSLASLPSPLSAFRKYVPFSPARHKTLSQCLTSRNPLHNLTNWPHDIETLQSGFSSDASQLSQPNIDRMEKENDSFPGLHSMTMTRKQKAQAIKMEQIALKENCLPVNMSDESESDSKQTKVDLRKTSWMNGFMMYSRLNRRSFIDANPGVLTSNISKMMGQAWRNMSDTEQIPYKEKAKQFSQEMQRDLDNFGMEVFGSSEEQHYSLDEPISAESLDSLLLVKQEKEFLF